MHQWCLDFHENVELYGETLHPTPYCFQPLGSSGLAAAAILPFNSALNVRFFFADLPADATAPPFFACRACCAAFILMIVAEDRLPLRPSLVAGDGDSLNNGCLRLP